MNFFETVIAGVHAAVVSALPCEALPVRSALRLLLSGQNMPIRALVTCSIYPAQAGTNVGTALDLIHIGLQQLHSRVDATTGTSALLGNAATVLAGDYLTSGAFRLLVRGNDLRVLALVSNAVNRASELEAARLGQDQRTPCGSLGCLQSLRVLAAPLGEAAGATGATLADYPGYLVGIAQRYGEYLVSSFVLSQEINDILSAQLRPVLHGAALDLCLQATDEARAIMTSTGNSRPLELTELLAARIGTKASKYNTEISTSASS